MENNLRKGILKQQAISLFQNGKITQAKVAFLDLSRKYPKDWEVWNMLSAIHGMLEEYELCERCCKKTITLQPGHIGAHINLGNALKFQGKLQQAEKNYKRILKGNPVHVEAHNNLGTLYLESNRINEARKCFTQALRHQPDYADAIANMGKLSQDEGDTGTAVDYFCKAIKLQPDNLEYQYNLGCVLSASGEIDGAVSTFRQVIRLNPQHAQAWSSLGYALYMAGKRDEALQSCEQALQLKPDAPDTHFTKGIALQALGRLDEAIESFKTALRHNPELTNAKYFLATLGAEEVPAQSPEDYITELFDGCANRFDNDLVNTLGYRAPEQLFEAISGLPDFNQSAKLDILDLGCGTGLCGVAFAGNINHLTGVDLAPRMLSKSRERGLYTDLIQADVITALQQSGKIFDLILSADVFIYIGKLDEVFELAREHLKPGGLFAFSIETLNTEEDYRLEHTGRYAQSDDYIQQLTAHNGFEELLSSPVALRHENGTPVDGKIIVLRHT